MPMNTKLRADEWDLLTKLNARLLDVIPKVDRMGPIYVKNPELGGQLSGAAKRLQALVREMLDADYEFEKANPPK